MRDLCGSDGVGTADEEDCYAGTAGWETRGLRGGQGGDDCMSEAARADPEGTFFEGLCSMNQVDEVALLGRIAKDDGLCVGEMLMDLGCDGIDRETRRKVVNSVASGQVGEHIKDG